MKSHEKQLKADPDWLCMTENKDIPCPEWAISICKQLYINLKCNKGAR